MKRWTKHILVALTVLAILFAFSTPMVARADPGTNSGNGDGSNSSYSGATHGAFADVNGNFGFLGDAGGTPGYHGGATGQDPGATGSNNCHVMGNCP